MLTYYITIAILYLQINIKNKFSILKIQYSMDKPCGANNTICSYFGNIAVKKKDRTCQGLICQSGT